MPLIDPVTMASTLTKRGPGAAVAATVGTSSASPLTTIEQAKDTTAVTYSLLPVKLNPTPLSQTLRHVHPLLLSALLAARFPALVSDPVAAMSGTILPITAALQVAYAVVCLPVAGGASQSKSKKSKFKGAAGKSKATAGDGGNNAIVTALLSLLLTAFSVPFLYITMILFGAPVLSHGAHTLLCAAQIAVLGLFPLFYVHGVDGSAWAAVGGFKAPLDQTFGGFVGALVGGWLGAVPIPLDWDREWQRWPVTILVGVFGGYVLGEALGGSVVWGKRF
ncbi:putative glycosylphosphatidylinositol anchor biosynthesis protein 11 [Cladorrhinum sp. PSN259]|nr:putative glycosylphosphatidylinositol anchor biosynthesis protein 11 [Cladorrhinum sp. PSN259]